MSGQAMGALLLLLGLALAWWWVGFLALLVVSLGLALAGVGSVLLVWGGGRGGVPGGVARGGGLLLRACPDCGAALEPDVLAKPRPSCPACARPLGPRAFVLPGSYMPRDEANGGGAYSEAELRLIDRLRGRAGR